MNKKTKYKQKKREDGEEGKPNKKTNKQITGINLSMTLTKKYFLSTLNEILDNLTISLILIIATRY